MKEDILCFSHAPKYKGPQPPGHGSVACWEPSHTAGGEQIVIKLLLYLQTLPIAQEVRWQEYTEELYKKPR